MHLVLKQETTRPAGRNFLQQQERFDSFVHEYNFERPHEALGQRPPADLFARSPRAFPETIPEPEYPLHDAVRRVTASGHVHISPLERCFLTTVLAGELVGLREVDDGLWLSSFMNLDLGVYDLRAKAFSPIAPDKQEKQQDEQP
jgi:hypothetical protein